MKKQKEIERLDVTMALFLGFSLGLFAGIIVGIFIYM